jgi:hypothetical protein
MREKVKHCGGFRAGTTLAGEEMHAHAHGLTILNRWCLFADWAKLASSDGNEDPRLGAHPSREPGEDCCHRSQIFACGAGVRQ